MNINQTPIKFVLVDNKTLSIWGGHSLTVKSSADKRSITGTFAISFTGKLSSNTAYLWEQ